MIERYATGLTREIDAVFRRHPDLHDHRHEFPWLRGWLGDPFAGVWFVGENPSLGMVERQQRQHGSRATPEAQWGASRGDHLLREMLVKHGFKDGPPASEGGWRCYLTNVVKEADYTRRWREKSRNLLLRAAEIWAPVLRWELETSRPRLVVAMGKQPLAMLRHLEDTGLIDLPRVVGIAHYAYIGQRAEGTLGPMHPERVAEYGREFEEVVRIARHDVTRTGTATPPGTFAPRQTPTDELRTQSHAGTPVASYRPPSGFASLLIGQLLGQRYHIDALIGRGGMGAVYHATDERLRRDVALKVISVESADSEVMDTMRGRFRREARAVARLRHPNVVAVHDYGTEERLGLDYLVMELLEGEDLAARLSRTEQLSLPTAVHILAEAGYGVAAGHRAGLVHRDIKPANLFLERADVEGALRVRVLDFGIAQIAEAADETLTHLTVAANRPLSPAYASPEQLRRAGELSPAADVFCLGTVGFEMVTGTRPFSPSDIQQIAAGHDVPVPSARQRNPQVPNALDRALRKAMALSAEERYADAAEFASAVLRAADDLDGASRLFVARGYDLPAEGAAETALPTGPEPSLDQYPAPIGRRWQRPSGTAAADEGRPGKKVPTVAELEGRVLRIKPEVLRKGNPRGPYTHGWLAFEILLRQEGGCMPFAEYRRQLFHPAPEIRALARQIPGVPDAYQDLKHIRHDIRCGRVSVE